MMTLRRLLLCGIALELLVSAVLISRRLMHAHPPSPDLSGLDSITRADLDRARAQAIHGAGPDWRSLAQALLGQGYYVEAEQCFREACRLAPADQESVYGLGFCLERVGRMQSAIEALERAARLSDDELSRTCVYQIGRCYLRLEDARRAEATFRRIPESSPGAYQLAKLLIRTGRADEAVAIIDAQLQSLPNSLKFTQLHARAAEALGDEQSAALYRDRERRAEYKLVLEYGMTFFSMYRSRYGLDGRLAHCAMLKRTGSMPEQVECLQRPLAIIRHENLLQYDSVPEALAELAIRLGRPDEALILLDELQQQGMESLSQMALRGDALWLSGDRKAARETWERAARMRDSPELERKLAESCELEDDQAQAAAYHARRHQLLGLAAYQTNRIDEAERHFMAALEDAPESARNWYYLGEVERLQGHVAKARDAYCRCLELDIDYERARRALAGVETAER